MRNHLVFAVLAAALGAAAPVLAASSAQASIEDFTLTLYDLDLGDGVTPSVSFAAGGFPVRGSRTGATALNSASGQQTSEGWSLQPIGASASFAQVAGASARATLTGSVFTGGADFRAAGSAAGAAVPGFATSFSAVAQAGGNFFFDGLSFTVTPHTLAVFSGTVDLFAKTTVGIELGSFAGESGSAAAALTISGTGAGGAGSQTASSGFTVSATNTFEFDPVTGTFRPFGQTVVLEDALLSGTFSNITATPLNGTLSLSASVNGSSAVTAVPEPASTTMLMAGLACLGLLKRRRQAT